MGSEPLRVQEADFLDNRSLGVSYDTRRQGSQNQVTTLGPRQGRQIAQRTQQARQRACSFASWITCPLGSGLEPTLWLPSEKNGSVFSDMPVFLQMCKNHILHEISWSLNFGHGEIFHVPKRNTSVLRLMGFHLIVTIENHWSRINFNTC